MPVPLTKERFSRRGYNQSEEIAQGVSEITGLPILKKAVRRTVFEGSQTNKGRWERHDNVERVFELIDEKAISGRHLLLIDDVVTTGATCLACAKALCQSGGVRISILSLGFAKS